MCRWVVPVCLSARVCKFKVELWNKCAWISGFGTVFRFLPSSKGVMWSCPLPWWPLLFKSSACNSHPPSTLFSFFACILLASLSWRAACFVSSERLYFEVFRMVKIRAFSGQSLEFSWTCALVLLELFLFFFCSIERQQNGVEELFGAYQWSSSHYLSLFMGVSQHHSVDFSACWTVHLLTYLVTSRTPSLQLKQKFPDLQRINSTGHVCNCLLPCTLHLHCCQFSGKQKLRKIFVVSRAISDNWRTGWIPWWFRFAASRLKSKWAKFLRQKILNVLLLFIDQNACTES